jgi:hypothetical protein
VRFITPRCRQDGRPNVTLLTTRFLHEKREIIDEPITERPDGRLMQGIHPQVVPTREFSHLFPTPTIHAQPPDSESSGDTRAEEPQRR